MLKNVDDIEYIGFKKAYGVCDITKIEKDARYYFFTVYYKSGKTRSLCVSKEGLEKEKRLKDAVKNG